MFKASTTLVEETPRLTMKAIRKRDLSPNSGHGFILLDNSDLWVEVTRYGEALVVVGPGFSQVVQMLSVQKTFGFATYFARPDGKGRCTALYLVDDEFVSRDPSKLSYASQRLGPAARKRKTAAKLADRISKSPQREATSTSRRAGRVRKLEGLAAFHDEQTRAELAREQERAARRVQSDRALARKTPNLGVRVPLLEAWAQAADVIDTLGGAVLVPAAGLPRLASKLGPKRGAPELQIRRLMKDGVVPSSCRQWGEGENALVVFVSPDPKDQEQMTLRLDICVGCPARRLIGRQIVQLKGGKRKGDLFFRCPVTGERALTLYFREGRFASAFAQKLRSFDGPENRDLSSDLVTPQIETVAARPSPPSERIAPAPAGSAAKQAAPRKGAGLFWPTPEEQRELERQAETARFNELLSIFDKPRE